MFSGGHKFNASAVPFTSHQDQQETKEPLGSFKCIHNNYLVSFKVTGWQWKFQLANGFSPWISSNRKGNSHYKESEEWIQLLICISSHYILFYSIPFHSFPFHSILFYSILFYSILFYSIRLYSILFPKTWASNAQGIKRHHMSLSLSLLSPALWPWRESV